MAQKIDFKFSSGNNIFFTSDTHFNHENIIQFCNRPFSSLQEMNETMIENWNNIVPKDGIVFHLGDFAWGGFQSWLGIRERLNGEIILIKGNHDFKNGPQSEQQNSTLFKYVSQQLRIEIEGRKLWLNHVPFLCYSGVYRDEKGLEFQPFGHCHTSNVAERNGGKDISRCLEMLFPTQYDVGVDFNDFKPMTWNELNEKILEQVKKETNLKMWIK